MGGSSGQGCWAEWELAVSREAREGRYIQRGVAGGVRRVEGARAEKTRSQKTEAGLKAEVTDKSGGAKSDG